MWVVGGQLCHQVKCSMLISHVPTTSQCPGPAPWPDRGNCVCVCARLTSTGNQKNMTWLFSNNSRPHCCSALGCCRMPAKTLFPVDFFNLLGVKSWSPWRPLPGEKEWMREKELGQASLIEPLHFGKSIRRSICFVGGQVSRLIQSYLRGHWVSGLINDDC